MHFDACYLPVSVYLSRPTILSALNKIGLFQNKTELMAQFFNNLLNIPGLFFNPENSKKIETLLEFP